MAEYLCEADMSTGEYISRDLALRQLNATCLATDCDNYNGVRCRACAYADAMDFINDIPAADVQPVDRWISVDDKLPKEWYEVLVYREIGKTEQAIYVNGKWKLTAFIGDIADVTHWQPLPEPPKDGDK